MFFLPIIDEPNSAEPRVFEDDVRQQKYARKWRRIAHVNQKKKV